MVRGNIEAVLTLGTAAAGACLLDEDSSAKAGFGTLTKNSQQYAG